MIISSQRFINEEIVSQKVEALIGTTTLVLPVFPVEIDGDSMMILADGHHTLEAAKRLGITIQFEATDHPEGLAGQELLEECWMDSDYYDVATGRNVW